jgi:hypothetical protein
MFIIVTAITLWSLFLSGTLMTEPALPGHQLSTLAVLLPTTIAGFLLYILWLVAGVCVVYNRVAFSVVGPPSRLSPGRQCIQWCAKLGMPANFRSLDITLLALGILLLLLGWFSGIASALLVGVVVIGGLLGNRVEQFLKK